MFDAPLNKPVSGFTVPKYPHTCNSCQHKTEVAFVVVRDKSGNTKKGAFSQYGYVDKDKSWRLKDGYEFMGWITYCADHYQP